MPLRMNIPVDEFVLVIGGVIEVPATVEQLCQMKHGPRARVVIDDGPDERAPTSGVFVRAPRKLPATSSRGEGVRAVLDVLAEGAFTSGQVRARLPGMRIAKVPMTLAGLVHRGVVTRSGERGSYVYSLASNAAVDQTYRALGRGKKTHLLPPAPEAPKAVAPTSGDGLSTMDKVLRVLAQAGAPVSRPELESVVVDQLTTKGAAFSALATTHERGWTKRTGTQRFYRYELRPNWQKLKERFDASVAKAKRESGKRLGLALRSSPTLQKRARAGMKKAKLARKEALNGHSLNGARGPAKTVVESAVMQ